MLYFSRWKALGDAADGLCRVPVRGSQLLQRRDHRKLPGWAQRHVVLGLDLQGGSHILLEVDANYVRKEKAEQLRDDVRRVLRENRVGYTGLVVRGLTVEVRIREESNFDTALSKLRELAQPLGGLLSATGQRSLDVVDAGNRLIQLTITQPAITERIRQAVEQSIQIVERRVNELGTVEPSDPAPGHRPYPGAGAGPQRSGAAAADPRQDREAHLPDGRYDQQRASRHCKARSRPRTTCFTGRRKTASRVI